MDNLEKNCLQKLAERVQGVMGDPRRRAQNIRKKTSTLFCPSILWDRKLRHRALQYGSAYERRGNRWEVYFNNGNFQLKELMQ